MFSRRGLNLLECLNKYRENVKRFDAMIALKNLEIKSIKDDFFSATYTVTPETCNFHDIMHGGFTGAMVDCVLQYAYYAHPLGDSAATTNLNITYFSKAVLGDKIRLECRPVRITGKLGIIDCVFINEKNNEIISRGTGTLVNTSEAYLKHGIKVFGFDMSESNV